MVLMSATIVAGQVIAHLIQLYLASARTVVILTPQGSNTTSRPIARIALNAHFFPLLMFTKRKLRIQPTSIRTALLVTARESTFSICVSKLRKLLTGRELKD